MSLSNVEIVRPVGNKIQIEILNCLGIDKVKFHELCKFNKSTSLSSFDAESLFA